MPYDLPATNPNAPRFLPKRATLVLDGARGTTLAVEQGSLWVTLERDPRDVILAAGTRFRIDRDGRTIVAAEEDSRLRVIRRRGCVERVFAWLSRRAVALLRALPQRRRPAGVPYY
jgi:Protein of unknown function (DUF2917)